jgi:EAL domain-containing protein (putative c-di-GMP-specific phosphodiesterase class I)
MNLNDMPFSELKIDRALVTSGTSSPKSWTILESIIMLADRLGLQTVAEGIQSPHQWRFLTEMGCRAGQSFYIAKPMSYSDTTEYFDQNAFLMPISLDPHLM